MRHFEGSPTFKALKTKLILQSIAVGVIGAYMYSFYVDHFVRQPREDFYKQLKDWRRQKKLQEIEFNQKLLSNINHELEKRVTLEKQSQPQEQ